MKNLEQRFNTLDAEAQEAVLNATNDLIDVMESEKGCAVLLIDKNCDGVGVVMALGNRMLIEPLMATAGMMAKNIFGDDERVMQ